LGGQNIELVQHANEVTFVGQIWQFVTPNYYIPRAFVPIQSTLIVGYYTFELVPILNPIATNSELKHNQLLI
jgi:hypothetical protein